MINSLAAGLTPINVGISLTHTLEKTFRHFIRFFKHTKPRTSKHRARIPSSFLNAWLCIHYVNATNIQIY